MSWAPPWHVFERAEFAIWRCKFCCGYCVSETRPHREAVVTSISIDDALRKAIEDAKAARPVDISPYLFCNRRGECYVDEATGEARGWRSMWQRLMKRVMTETEVNERFTEHDLRAKVGSDAESLERARQLLAHADSRTTQKVYRRKPEIVKPMK